MPLMARQAPKGARTSKRKPLRKSNCRNTGDGVGARGRQGTGTGPAPPSREGDARGRAPRSGDHPPAKWPLPQGGEHRGKTGRGDLARSPARLRGPRLDLGMHVLKPRGEHARDLGWCHLRKGGRLRAPHPLRDRGPGTGAGHLEGVEDPGAPMEGEPRTDCHLRVREERKAHFRWCGRGTTRCRSWQ
jgi:hypothetical protein